MSAAKKVASEEPSHASENGWHVLLVIAVGIVLYLATASLFFLLGSRAG